MRIVFCGTRGSTPAPGVPFTRYGGQTSCVAVFSDDGECRLVLDAGTGLRRLGAVLEGQPFRGALLLTHLHWDHTHGLPFSGAVDNPGAQTSMYIPAQPGGDPEEIMARAMSPPHFPIRPREMRGDWRFLHLDEGSHDIEGFAVLALEIPHKGGTTYGYRVSDGHTALAYMPDHAPIALGEGRDGFGPYHDNALRLVEGADILLHDSQYTREEFPARAHFGHSTIDYAIGLGREAGARHVVLFHHDPSRSDEQLDGIVAAWRGHDPPVSAAVEGEVIEVAERTPA
ncbi:MAG: MBL fold metallo-hydrolase [Candidatus Dormibacteraeota bacterium]|nr:MBL fold metallo-hydrolase [Candidatus Dormibacteraeota bacterium]MBV9524275.1 MBL fold metallo-hydrolase [Candidatus Dormibacteraeota bacterium]